jgi:outer membrane protein
MRRIALILVVCMILAPAVTSAGDWVLRLRAINISPNESSAKIGDTGSEVAVDSATVPEVDLTYMFTKRLGVEVVAAVADHDLSASGGALSGADLGTVSLLPPTVVAQFHPFPGGLFDFYVGAGVNFTTFYDYDLSGTLADIGVTDIEFDDSFGLAGDVGLSIYFGDHLHINGDIKYIQISTDAKIRVGSDTLDTVSVDIDPWVFGLGVGWKF